MQKPTSIQHSGISPAPQSSWLLQKVGNFVKKYLLSKEPKYNYSPLKKKSPGNFETQQQLDSKSQPINQDQFMTFNSNQFVQQEPDLRQPRNLQNFTYNYITPNLNDQNQL